MADDVLTRVRWRTWLICSAVCLIAAAGPSRADAADWLCDPAAEDCRAPLLNLIRNEQVGIDVAFWFMEDARYTYELMQRFRTGVRVRVLMDTRANGSNLHNAARLAELKTAGIPMRERVASGILHWKTMIFAGQNMVQFSGANYSADAFVFTVPYVNYVDEAIRFTGKPSVVNSFKRRFDDLWIDTSKYRNYANVGTLARTYPTYALDPELNFPPLQSYANRATARYKQEGQRIDAIMYRITDQRHTNALIDAVHRGVHVRLITEPQQYRDPSRLWHSWNLDRLYAAGVQIKHRKHQGLNHQKSVILYSQRMTIFGSSNWTTPSDQSQEEHNYFTTDAAVFQWFVNQFERKWHNLANVEENEAFVPLPPAQGPQTPTPANLAIGVATDNLTLKWHGGPWAHVYDVYLGTTPDPPLYAANLPLGPSQSASALQAYTLPTPLAFGTTYYWRIVGKTMANLGTSSPLWSFTTSATPPPGSAGLVSLPSPAAAPVGGRPHGARYDLLWRHKTGGWLAVWHMDGITMTGLASLSVNQVTDTNWRIAGVGDLNGDGHRDIVWQHAGSGRLAVWLLQGVRVTFTGYPSIDRVTDLSWKIKAVGDTNRDGLADLVWQNSSDGRLAVWFMSGTQVVGTLPLSIPRMSTAQWQIRAAGDTNGDGAADIVWHRSDTGELAVWYLNGAAVVATHRIGLRLTDSSWKLAGMQDVNGDGRSDLVWQHRDGQVATWYLNGPNVVGTATFNPSRTASLAWRVNGRD